MSGYLPPLMPVPPPCRLVNVWGVETAESKEIHKQWKEKCAEIAEENEERARHNRKLREIGYI